jgi:hypothetical protein
MAHGKQPLKIMPLTPLPIRLFCDLAARQNVVDLSTLQAPVFFRGDDIEIDIGIGLNGLLLTSLSNVASVTCQIFQSENDTNAPMMSGTVLAAAMNLGLTQPQWTANTSPFYHAAFIFPNSQTAISLNGQASVNYWLRLTAQTTDSPPRVITLLDGPITVKDGPISTASAPPVGGFRLYTVAGQIVPQVLNGSDGKFYTLMVETVAGLPTLTLSDTGY